MPPSKTRFLEEGPVSVSVQGYFINYLELVLGLVLVGAAVVLGLSTEYIFALGCSYALLAGLGAHIATTSFKARYLSAFESRFRLAPNAVVESTGARYGCLPIFLSLITVLLYLLFYLS